MTRVQKKALKARVRTNLKFQKKELRKLSALGTRYHIRRDRFFKSAVSALKKEIRFYQRLNRKIAG